MFRLQIRNKTNFESRMYYCKSFETRPDPSPLAKDGDIEVLLYGMSTNPFPNRSDAAIVIKTNSYIFVNLPEQKPDGY